MCRFSILYHKAVKNDRCDFYKMKIRRRLVCYENRYTALNCIGDDNMLTLLQIGLLVATIMLIGVLSGIAFYNLENRSNSSGKFLINFFDKNETRKMTDSDISINEAIKNFKLIDCVGDV